MLVHCPTCAMLRVAIAICFNHPKIQTFYAQKSPTALLGHKQLLAVFNK
jgi:hypothetical protein